MTFRPLEIQDCMNIIKAFEQGASYSVTEESVFAMMTPILSGIEIQSASLSKHLEATELLSLPKPLQQQIGEDGAYTLGEDGSSTNYNNMDKSDGDDEGFLSKVKGSFIPGSTGEDSTELADVAGGLFNNECIPCGDRLNMLGELDPSKFLDMGKAYLASWISWLTSQLNTLNNLSRLFNNTDNYIDLCSLLRWMNDYICIPDLQRMLSVLMALMNRVSLEMGGMLDMIIGLTGPLLVPILSGFVDLLQSYILLIVRPIDCIVDSIQEIIRKLDYNVLFENIDALDKHVSIGSDVAFSANVKIPFVGTEVKYEIPGPGVSTTSFNVAGPAAGAIRRQNAQDQAALESAARELKAIRNAGKSIDASNAAAVEQHNQQRKDAEQKYRDALEEATLSELGEVSVAAEEGVAHMKSALFTLTGFLTEAAQVTEGFFQDAFDELNKIMGSYVGGGDAFTEQLFKKLSLVQMISFISSVITAFANGIQCGEEDDLKVESFLPEDTGFKVWTDNQGVIHIEESDKDFSDAVDAMAEAMAANSTSISSNDGAAENAAADDKGNNSDNSRQDLKHLVEFTGNPTLDTQIAQVTDSLVSRVNATFKCPLQTSEANAEQVNKWIQELNS